MQRKSVAQAISEARRRLIDAGIASAPLDARLIVQHVTGLRHEDIVAGTPRLLPSSDSRRIEKLLRRREAREPISRLTGEREFYGRSFSLNRGTLDPRPDTEILVEAALALARAQHGEGATLRIADIGTGSGAIAISLLAELVHAEAVASDVSRLALRKARENSLRHKVADRLTLVHGRWFAKIEGFFDLILSNPPYIPAAEMALLPDEVRLHDPSQALRGGADGFGAYRQIAKEVGKHLKTGGHLLVEIGKDQEEGVRAIMLRHGLKAACKVNPATPDLSGTIRVLAFVNDPGQPKRASREVKKLKLESVA
jgi:release factor glutamine methyltransferase